MSTASLLITLLRISLTKLSKLNCKSSLFNLWTIKTRSTYTSISLCSKLKKGHLNKSLNRSNSNWEIRLNSTTSISSHPQRLREKHHLSREFLKGKWCLRQSSWDSPKMVRIHLTRETKITLLWSTRNPLYFRPYLRVSLIRSHFSMNKDLESIKVKLTWSRLTLCLKILRIQLESLLNSTRAKPQNKINTMIGQNHQ